MNYFILQRSSNLISFYYATSIHQTYSSLGYLQNIVYVISEVEEWLLLYYDRDVLFTLTQGSLTQRLHSLVCYSFRM